MAPTMSFKTADRPGIGDLGARQRGLELLFVRHALVMNDAPQHIGIRGHRRGAANCGKNGSSQVALGSGHVPLLTWQIQFVKRSFLAQE